MENLKDYLTATHGNGADQREASTRLLEHWVSMISKHPMRLSFLKSTGAPLAMLYLIERVHAVAAGEPFIANNPGQPVHRFRNDEIHKSVEGHRAEGHTIDQSVTMTTNELTEGTITGELKKEVLSERSVKNIHAKGSSKTDKEWSNWIIKRFRELGQTIVDDRE